MLKLFKNLKPYWLPIIGIVLFILFQVLSELFLPTIMADIVDIGIVKGDIPYIVRHGGWMLLATFLGTLCAIAAGFLSSRTGLAFGRDLRTQVFKRVTAFSLHEFDELGTASLITRTTNDITQIQNLVIMVLRMFIMAPLMLIGGIFMSVSMDPTLSLVLVGVLPFLVGLIAFIATKSIPMFKTMQLKIDRMNLVLRENLTGLRVIRAFNRIDFEQGRFHEANTDLMSVSIAVNKLMALLMPLMMLIFNFTTIAIIWYGSIRIDAGSMEVGSLMAFIQYAMQILFSLIMATMMFIMVPRASASATRINEVLNTEATIINPINALTTQGGNGHLRFENVTFSYPGAEEPALSEITIEAFPGEITAIIGGTGSGKSTLINLIPRFYDIQSGRILLDGVDIREMTQESLRDIIGLVPQQAVLFSGTIAGNIRFGSQDLSDEAVRQAADIAQATAFIEEMPEGFDAVIAQGGVNVSGGQKQRLAIARALAAKPDIYIFDDSFSSLDFKTDAKLRRALKAETAKATVIIVAQRVTTVIDADCIIVLEDGRIVAMGNHKELLRVCPVYQEIVASQLSEEEIK
jgi:ATP-binding cassette subfamily B protein